MASISDKKIVDEITSNEGVYGAGTAEADPAVTHIIEYGNMFNGGVTYSLAWSKEEHKHQWETGFFAWKRLYWTLERGFSSTIDGPSVLGDTKECLFDAEERALDICDCGIAGGCK
jgi:hypothetical protein